MQQTSMPVGEPSIAQNCLICNEDQFKEGPLGRLSATGYLPCCARCGSLERHRGIRLAWDQIPAGFTAGSEALHFSRDPSVDKNRFKSIEYSIYGHENSLDLQAIDRPDASYDIVICNHVLEHVEQDRQAFRELLRVLRPEGFLQFSVPNPAMRSVTEDWGYPKAEQHGHYRLYGRDLLAYFEAAAPGVKIYEVMAKDPITQVSDYLYFATTADTTGDQLRHFIPASL